MEKEGTEKGVLDTVFGFFGFLFDSSKVPNESASKRIDFDDLLFHFFESMLIYIIVWEIIDLFYWKNRDIGSFSTTDLYSTKLKFSFIIKQLSLFICYLSHLVIFDSRDNRRDP